MKAYLFYKGIVEESAKISTVLSFRQYSEAVK